MERPNVTDEESLDAYLTKLCSDATLQSQKEGFFNQWAEEIQKRLPKEFMTKFETSKSNAERFKSVWKEECVHSLDIQKFFTGKNRDVSEQRRQEGNKAFQANDNQKSLFLYSQAVIRAPFNSPDFPLALANRSAALFHLEEFDLCLEDISLALKYGYPQNLQYKVYDRRGMCYMKLGLKHEAQEAFNNSIAALGKSELGEAKTKSLEMDLERKLQTCDGSEHCNAKNRKDLKKEEIIHEPLFDGSSKILSKASAAVCLSYSSDCGRFMTAAKDIPAGKVLIRESPFSSVLKQEKRGTFCEHCLSRIIASIPCESCSGVAFCGIICQEKAQKSYHKWECPYLDLLKASGMSLNCYLSLRVITERGLDYFRKISSALVTDTKLPTAVAPYDPESYVSFFNLVALESQRHALDFFRRTLMSAFLLKVLQNGKFFGPAKLSADTEDLSEDELLIGSLILQHLQVIQFNAHEVSGISFEGEISFKNCKSVYLGLAVYPTISFCNHSCHPAVGRYFDGKEMTIVNLRPLKAGEIVAENYGPLFTHNTKQERHKKLLSRYWFRCSCEACKNDWPKYANMSNTIQLKAGAQSSTPDPQSDPQPVPPANSNTESKKNKKNKRKKNKNASKENYKERKNELGKVEQNDESANEAIKSVLEAHKNFSIGVSLMDEGKREESIEAYLKWVSAAANTVQLPLKDLHLALEALRLLVAARGTHYVAPKK